MPTVEEAVFEYLNYCGLSPTIKLDRSLRLDEDLNLDSLDVVELTLHLEDLLEVPVGDDTDDIRHAETVGDLIELIKTKYGLT